MSRLATGLASGGRFNHGLASGGRIGRGRQRGVGGVDAEALLQFGHLMLQLGDLLLQSSNQDIPITTALTDVHHA